MSISSLFSGMEAYLDGDVEINNNVSAPEGDAAEDVEAAEQTAEVASDTADASEEAKDTEVASQMLSRMCDMYDHVKQFGIDRTFVSLYNRHGELDRVCGIQFPSYESMDVVGDCYSRYSTAFIAAMESSGSGLWAKIKAVIAKIWNWIKNTFTKLWDKILSLFGRKKGLISKGLNSIRQMNSNIYITIKSGLKKYRHLAGNAVSWIATHKKKAAMLAGILILISQFVSKLGIIGRYINANVSMAVNGTLGAIMGAATGAAQGAVNGIAEGADGHLITGAAATVLKPLVEIGSGIIRGAMSYGSYVVNGTESYKESYPGLESDNDSTTRIPVGKLTKDATVVDRESGGILKTLTGAAAKITQAAGKIYAFIQSLPDTALGKKVGAFISKVYSAIQSLLSAIGKDGNDINNVNDEISKAIDGAAHSADIAAIKRGDVIGFSRA